MNGWLIFAAVIMFVVGFHNLIYGIASLRDYTVVVNTLNGTGNVIYADRNFWGWLWIAVGVVMMIISFGIAIRNQAARWAGVAIAAINAIGQLAVLSAFPVWSLVIIAIDVLVIYTLCTYDNRGAYDEPYPSDRPGMTAGRGAGVGGRGEGGGARVTSGAPSESLGRDAGHRESVNRPDEGYRPPASG